MLTCSARSPGGARAIASWLVLAALTLGLAGCGFHLRGHTPATATARHIYVKGPGWLQDEAQVLLEAAGGGLADEPAGADASIRVRDSGFDRRVIASDPQTGKEREIQLAFTVYFDLRDANQVEVLENERVNILREYTLDADDVLGKGREENVLRLEMERTAARQVLRRVESTLWR